MNEHRTAQASLDLLWSLWTELGVPGPRRAHEHTVIDPERLVAYTPWFARADARLSDLAFSWCTQHGHRLSGSRMATVVGASPEDVQHAAEVFLAELAACGVTLLRTRTPPSTRPRTRRKVPVPMERPALLRLRVRALVGVGGRADVLVALLSAPNTWVSASTLVEDVAFAKRQVARVLSDLADAKLVHARTLGNTHQFRLADAPSLGTLVHAQQDTSYPPWQHIFDWVHLANTLIGLPSDRPATYRVEVAKRTADLRSLAELLRFPAPPPLPQTDPAEVIAWATAHTEALATGSAACLVR